MLISMNNLAELLKSQSKYDEIELMFHKTLILRTKMLKKKHFNMLMSMNNLALLLNVQGKYDEAEPMYCETLVLRKREGTPQHPVERLLLCLLVPPKKAVPQCFITLPKSVHWL